jgi:integrase
MGDPIKKITLKSGKTRYRFVVDIGDDPVTGKRRQKTFTFDKKREADAELDRIRHKTREGTFVVPGKVTLDEWLDEWLRTATIDVEVATAANYRDALRPARLRLGSRALQKLTEHDVDELVSWMLTEGRIRGGKPGTGLGLRSVQLTLNRLRAALAEAVRRQLIIRNVAQYTKIPRAARTAAAKAKAARQPWEADEVRKFLVAIKDERLFAPMLLSLLGMRPAEVCGLRWSDVDFDAEDLRIENTRTLVDGEMIEKDTKSDKGTRALPLPAPVTAALKSFKAKQAGEKLALGEDYADTGYVLVDELGEPVRTDWLRRRFYELMETAGVRRVRLYDARHACLTFLATNGVPDVIVSAWAGHADLSFTKRTYVHPSASDLVAARDALAGLLG